ncbi:hypothetical protein FACS1894189_3630 [Planctomycetales bacterium]|nr:hypothetical protein FACS1894189_3630 [Planctomycetales bacterium]
MKAKIPESEIVKEILAAFKGDDNVMLFRRNVGAFPVSSPSGKTRYFRAAETGQSDIWGIVKRVVCPNCGATTGIGTHVEIECKTEKGKATEAQKDWIAKVSEYGGIAFLIRPDKDKDLLNIRDRILKMIHEPCSQCANPVPAEKRQNRNKMTVEEFNRRYGICKPSLIR